MSVDDKTTDRLFSKLDHGARQLDLPLQESQIELLVDFIRLVSKWNRVYNLTAIRDMDDMVGRHILDSLSVLRWLPKAVDGSKSNATSLSDVLDVGSGAGLPVIPLAIVRPDLTFLSVESNGKKTRFQHQAVLELGLDNVRIKQERIEDTKDLASIVISRAFSAPEKFIHAVEKNCVPESRVFIMLGQKDRMPESLPYNFKLSELVEIDVPQCDAVRHVAVCSRVTNAVGERS